MPRKSKPAVEPVAQGEEAALSLDVDPEVSEPDLVSSDVERDTATEMEIQPEEEPAAEATPTRRRKSKSKGKQVEFKDPLVESSDIEASEENGRG